MHIKYHNLKVNLTLVFPKILCLKILISKIKSKTELKSNFKIYIMLTSKYIIILKIQEMTKT